MAPKLTVDEGLRFVYICLKHKNSENIDFTGVSKEFENLKPGAARMRFYRLRDAIEAKTGDGGEVIESVSKMDMAEQTSKSVQSKAGKKATDGGKAKKRKFDAELAADDEGESFGASVKEEHA